MRGAVGLSGPNCFDEHGSPEAKDIQVGQFLSGELVSAPVQLQSVALAEVPDLEQALAQRKVLRVGEDWKAHADVVYTGFELTELSEVDVDDETVRLQFLLWFRGPPDDTMAEVVFSNAAGPVEMELVGEPVEGERAWLLYEVDGRFWMDWDEDSPDLDQYELGFSFHHRRLSAERLRYVADARAMDSGPRTHAPEGWRIASERTKIRRGTTRTRGHPGLLGVGDQGPAFSHFTHRVQVRPSGLTIRRQDRSEETPWGLFVAILGLLLLSNLDHRGRSRLTLAAVRGLQTAAAIGALLAFEEWLVSNWWMLPFRPEGWHRPELRELLRWVDAAWWILPAAALDRLIEEQIWVPLESRTRRIPNVVRRLGTVLLYTLAACGIIAFVADAKLTSLVATSGVLTLVIGLGLQANLGNLMAGLALNLEQPFRIGDRVQIGDYDPGEVVDITWRTTKLRLEDGSELNVPNLTASSEKLVRLGQPAEE